MVTNYFKTIRVESIKFVFIIIFKQKKIIDFLLIIFYYHFKLTNKKHPLYTQFCKLKFLRINHIFIN
jgi:hypothetical protein